MIRDPKDRPTARDLVAEQREMKSTTDPDLKDIPLRSIITALSNLDKKKRKCVEGKIDILTKDASLTASAGIPILSDFINLSMHRSLDRHFVQYIPDLQGLGDVAFHTWEVCRMKEPNITKDFHYLMFLEETMRVACLYIVYCMNLVRSVDPIWVHPWILKECIKLQGIPIPKFLSVFLSSVGSFNGTHGSDFYWCMPRGLYDADESGIVLAEYTTAFPSFRLYRRIMKNLINKQTWWWFAADGHKVTSANPSIFTQEEAAKMPGLRDPPSAIHKRIRENLANHDLETDSSNGFTARYYFQADNTAYDNYRSLVFHRMEKDGFPCTVLELPKSVISGGIIPNFVVHPEKEDDEVPENFYLSTAISPFDQEAMVTAALYKPSYLKGSGQHIFTNEKIENRFDKELMPSKLTSNIYNSCRMIRGYSTKFFTVS